jgi:hypothetical protein
MNTRLARLLIGLALLSTLNSPIPTCLAKGTAFTYQGRLNDGAGAASGIYDLRFTTPASASVSWPGR